MSFAARFKIKARIAILALIPSFGLVAASAVIINGRLNDLAEMDKASVLTQLTTDVSGYVHALQREAGASAAFVASRGADTIADLPALRKQSDAARSIVTQTLRTIDLAKISPEIDAVLQDGLSKSSNADGIRSSVSSFTIAPSEMNNFYTGSIVRLLDFSLNASKGISNPTVAREMRLYAYLLQFAEASSAARANAAIGFQEGAFGADLYNRVTSFVAKQDVFLNTLMLNADERERYTFNTIYSGEPVSETRRMLSVMTAAGLGGSVKGVSVADWLTANKNRMDLLTKVEDIYKNNLELAAATTRAQSSVELYGAITIAAIMILLTAVLGTAITLGIVRPLATIVQLMSRISNGDLRVEVNGLTRQDEIGDIARTLEVFRKDLEEAERLRAQAVANEHANAESIRKTRNEIADQFVAKMGALADGVSKSAQELSSAANSLSTTSAETSRQARLVSGAAEEASANVQTVAASTEEMTASVREIASQVSKSNSVANTAAVEAARTETDVRALSEAATKIGEVVELINNIAGQTNLLALNATIEAARAGEAGKGFAVVASEVKQLAAQTAKATDEISSKINEIQSATSRTVTSIDRIVKTVADIQSISTMISAAIEEQGAATGEIASNTQLAARGTEQVSENINGVGRASEMTAAASTQLMTLSNALSGQAGDLQTEVGNFVRQLRSA